MILALDVGLKRIGIAGLIQDIILPLEPILRQNRNQAASDTRDFIEAKGCTLLIVGLPDAPETKKRIQHFISLLQINIPILYINEDYTSQESQTQLSHFRKKSRQSAHKDGKLDSLAACKILERYLTQSATSL